MRDVLRTVALLGLLFGFFALAFPVVAHGNTLSVDPQLSKNGTVRIERTVAVAPSFVVLHTDENGTPGRVIGFRAVPSVGIHPGLQVEIDEPVWQNTSSNLTVWAVLHFDDDGNGVFNASVDQPITRALGDELVASRFTVGKATNATYVFAERNHAQRTNESHASIRRVALADPGYIVLKADANGSPGAVVGYRRLDSGVHRNVTVPIDDAFYAERPERFSLWAVVHRSNGDTVFDPAVDSAITAGDSPIASQFRIERTGNLSTHDEHEHEHEDGGGHDEGKHTTASPSATATRTLTPGTTATRTATSTVTTTPTSTTTVSPTSTAERSLTPTPASTTSSSTTAPPTSVPATETTPAANGHPATMTSDGERTTTVHTPGFGILGVIASTVLLLLVRSRRS